MARVILAGTFVLLRSLPSGLGSVPCTFDFRIQDDLVGLRKVLPTCRMSETADFLGFVARGNLPFGMHPDGESGALGGMVSGDAGKKRLGSAISRGLLAVWG